MARPKISVVIIGKNEERNVEECLQSVADWADEIVFVDDFSTDRTVELVKQFSVAVIHQRAMEQEGRHRNFGAQQASHDWIMILDCDERATPELLTEIDGLFDTKGDRDVAFWVPRKNYIGDYWLRHGGWYPAPHMKLYNRKYFRWKESVYDVVHPGMEFIEKGYKQGANLKNHLIHHNYKNVEDFIKKTNRLTTLDGIKWYLDGRNMGMGRAFRRTIDRFLRRYVRKQGYKDGYYGFISSVLSGFYELAAYSKLREIRQRGYYLKEYGITDEMIANAPLFDEPSSWKKFTIGLGATTKAWKTAWRNIQGKRYESEVDIVCRLLPNKAVGIDVGAGYGRYSYALLGKGRAKKVIAFEPVRFNTSVLNHIKQIFRLGGLKVTKFILGEAEGREYLISPRKKSGKIGYNLSYVSSTVVPDSLCERVDVQTLDKYVSDNDVDKIDIIISDVEGYEAKVLKGAKEVLSNMRPIILCSVVEYRMQRYDLSYKSINGILKESNYDAYVLANGQLQKENEVRSDANYFFFPKEKSAEIVSRLGASTS